MIAHKKSARRESTDHGKQADAGGGFRHHVAQGCGPLLILSLRVGELGMVHLRGLALPPVLALAPFRISCVLSFDVDALFERSLTFQAGGLDRPLLKSRF